jgi:hypothetical protein
MSTEAITLQVDSEAARVFKSASAEERKKWQFFFSFWVRACAESETASLSETMDEISEKARERGLTPEILNSILRED